jgi:hypothetical protein
MIRDLYSSLTAREQRADPWVLLTVPLIAGAFYAYHLRHRDDGPDEDDLDFF